MRRNIPQRTRRSSVRPAFNGNVRGIDVLNLVAEVCGVTVDEMKAPGKGRSLAYPRFLFWWSVDRLCPHISWPRMALMVGRQDHTSAMHGAAQMDVLIAEHLEWAERARIVITHFESGKAHQPQIELVAMGMSA